MRGLQKCWSHDDCVLIYASVADKAEFESHAIAFIMYEHESEVAASSAS